MAAINRFAIPADLTSRRQWVVWRREERDGKQTKVPYRADSPGARASTTDAHSWAPFERAFSVVDRGKADGIGFVFAAEDPFCGVDLDACRDDAGELNPVAAGLVTELDSYTEVSPSGAGMHVIVRARLAGKRNRRGPVELYDRGRYFAMTGEYVAGFPHSPMPRQRALDALVARLFPAPPAPADPVAVARPILEDDRELLERAFAAKNGADVQRLFGGDISGHGSHSEADLALVAHLAYWTGGDPVRVDALFRSSGLMRDKWDERRGDSSYGERTIAKALGRG